MPITRFHSLSDIELERELERRLDAEGQLVLGAELSRELMERVRRWVECDKTELQELREDVSRLESEIEELEDKLYETQEKLDNVND